MERYDSQIGFEKMFEWIQTFGKILAVHFYMPSSQSINDELWHKLWAKYHSQFHFFETVYCPKVRSEPNKRRIDNVDCHLIAHTKKIIEVFPDQVKYFCLASGDPGLFILIVATQKRAKNRNCVCVGEREDHFLTYTGKWKSQLSILQQAKI